MNGLTQVLVAVLPTFEIQGPHHRVALAVVFGSVFLLVGVIVGSVVASAVAGCLGRAVRWLAKDLMGPEGAGAARFLGALAGGALGGFLGLVWGLVDGCVASAVAGKIVGGCPGHGLSLALRPLFMGLGAILCGILSTLGGAGLGGCQKGSGGSCSSKPEA